MGHNKGDIIYSANTEFDNLRKAIQTEFNKRLVGMGDSALNKFSKYSRLTNELPETKNENINLANNATNTINVLVDMKMDGALSTELSKYDIIPELSQYYTIVNNLAAKTQENRYGCNAACSGYCYESCAGANHGTAGYDKSDTSPGGTQDYGCSKCGTACGYGCDSEYANSLAWCGCDGGCYSQCSGCSGGGYVKCSCGNSSCSGNCYGDCSGHVGGCGGCGSGCSTGCYTGCSSGCGQYCSGTCQYGSHT